MSINAKVNNETYTDIDTIIVGDKSIMLEQIQEQEEEEATNSWEGCLDNSNSLGFYLNGCEQATQTGKFVGGSTVTVDTGLGSDVKYFVIIDESVDAYPGAGTAEGIYFFLYDVANNKGISSFIYNGTNLFSGSEFNYGIVDTLLPRGGAGTAFENGVFTYVPVYDNNASYNNFLPNHTYVWYAW